MKKAVCLITLLSMLMATICQAEDAPTTAPSTTMTEEMRQQQMDELFKHLSTQVYGKALISKDWVTRCIAMISLSRLPHPKATDQILEALGSEKNPVGRCVLWQVMLARAPLLTQAQYDHWVLQTNKMMAANDFAGDLRIAVLEFLSMRPVNADARKFVQSIIANTNSLDEDDLMILKATGIALRNWSDVNLVENVIEVTKDPSASIRAQIVLKTAGVGDMPLAFEDVRTAYRKWIKANGKEWAGSKTVDKEAYKKLKPQYIPAPYPAASIDPFDKKWREEVELSAFKLKAMDCCFAIDVSGSMSQTLESMKKDIQMIFTVMAGLSDNTRVSYASYSGDGTIGFFPLSNDSKKIRTQFSTLKIQGGSQEEYGAALSKLLTGNAWNTDENVSRVIVVITDEGVNDQQIAELVKPVELCKKGKIKVYPVVIAYGENFAAGNIFDMELNRLGEDTVPRKFTETYMNLSLFSPYKALANATGGRPITLWTRQTPDLYLGKMTQTGALETEFRLPSLTWLPYVSRSGNHNARIVESVLLDAINPAYHDRVGPFVKVLISYAHGTQPLEKEVRKMPAPLPGRGTPSPF